MMQKLNSTSQWYQRSRLNILPAAEKERATNVFFTKSLILKNIAGTEDNNSKTAIGINAYTGMKTHLGGKGV